MPINKYSIYIFALLILMSSCSKWEIILMVVYSAISATNKVPPKYECGQISSTEQAKSLLSLGVAVPPDLLKTDYSKRSWVYSSLPVSAVKYSKSMDMLFITPSKSIKDDKTYFVAIDKQECSGVKMTAVSPSAPANETTPNNPSSSNRAAEK